MAQIAPILDLGPILERPKVRINGALYEMRTSDEFAYLAYRRQQQTFQRLGALLTKKRPTQADDKEQTRLLDVFVRELLVDVPEKVHEKLRDTHRLEIVKAFFSQRLIAPKTRATAASPAPTPARSRGLK